MNYSKYVDAVMFAMRKHEHQKRDDGQPYIVHPLRVAESLRAIAGCEDEDILCAAVLHDTIEDTNTSYDDLIKRFGKRVADWVAELTVERYTSRRSRLRRVRRLSWALAVGVL